MKWESVYLKNMKDLSNQLQNEGNDSLMLYYFSGRSYGDISATSVFQDMDILVLGIFLMFLYVLTILSKHNWVEWRVCMIITSLTISNK